MDPFAGIDAKLRRAQEHFDLLEELIGTYLESGPFHLKVEHGLEVRARRCDVVLEVSTYPPDEVWGPIIGDVVHNLRSSLDHVAWEYAEPSVKASDPRAISFPIALATRPTKAIGRMQPRVRSHIDAVQPYKTGNAEHPLWLLNSLWNMDKHRIVLTGGFLFGEPSSDPAAFGYGSWNKGSFKREYPQHRIVIASATSTGGPPIDVDQLTEPYENKVIDVSFEYSLDMPHEVQPYAGLPICEVLRKTAAFVIDDVIQPLRRP